VGSISTRRAGLVGRAARPHEVASATRYVVKQEERVVEDGPLTIRVDEQIDGCLVRVFGELDVANTASLDAELRRLEPHSIKEIVLDLSGLDLIDSAGAVLVVKATRRMHGDRLRVLRGSEPVERVFSLLGLDSLLSYAD
jgi:anti-anti-sigma factor